MLFKISLIIKDMQSSIYPSYHLVEQKPENIKHEIHILTKEESASVPEHLLSDFASSGEVVDYQNGKQIYFVVPARAHKVSVSKETYVHFSDLTAELSDYFGLASDLLACHKFSRKSKKPTAPNIYLPKNTSKVDEILSLTRAKNQNKEQCNGRGDLQGTPAFFQKLATQFAQSNGLSITVIKGDELLKQGFRLMHAVGRASKNQPTFINLKYHGNPDCDSWVSFVGKGVCFDAGGLDIKPASGMKDMHLDKCGAVSVFTAFQYVVQQKLKINLTASLGFVENFLADNSYRPSDIITSRKGITVQIGNTDAEGRLVLADCMSWTQQHYKTEVMIQLSTLTGAIITALGHKQAGLFTNNDDLAKDLITAGSQVHEQSWQMPLLDYHRDLVKHKYADITNSSGKTQASASQAAAFLENFVENGTKWIHLDIAGTSMTGGQGSGYGARLLVQYARNFASK